MSTSRTLGFVVVVVALLAGVTWWAFQGDPGEPADAATGELVATPMTPFEARREEHVGPWQDQEFAPDIAELKAGGGQTDPQSEYMLSYYATVKIEEELDSVSFHCKDATVPEVVEKLGALTKPLGIRVFTYDDPDIAQMVANHRFTIDVEDVRFFDIIDHIRSQSGERVRYIMTSLGLCVGGVAAIQKAQMDANEATAKVRAEADRKNTLLDTEYRPDFKDATIGAIRKTMREQTGIEVVVDAETWKTTNKLTWRDKPMPLRDALDRICEKMGCIYRVRSGRVFLLHP